MIVDDIVDRAGWDLSFLQDASSMSDEKRIRRSSPPVRLRTPSPLSPEGQDIRERLAIGRSHVINESRTMTTDPEDFHPFSSPPSEDKETSVRRHFMEFRKEDKSDVIAESVNDAAGMTRGVTLNNSPDEKCRVEFGKAATGTAPCGIFTSASRTNKQQPKCRAETQRVLSRNSSIALAPSSQLTPALTEDVIAKRSNIFMTDRAIKEDQTFGLITSSAQGCPFGIAFSGTSGIACSGPFGIASSGPFGIASSSSFGIASSGEPEGHIPHECATQFLANSSKSFASRLFNDPLQQVNAVNGQVVKDQNGGRSHSSWTLNHLSHLADRSPAPQQHASHEDAYSRAARFLAVWDLDSLKTVFTRLSVCGFYLGKMSIDEANHRLLPFPVGTFLLRDSSDRRFLFALSVQTQRGTTSIRIVYNAGLFRLDSDEDQAHIMPTFDCVLSLICHYVALSSSRYGGPRQGRRGVKNDYVFLESSGRKDTPVLLRRPLENVPARLAHICRRRIHGLLGGQSLDRLHLTPSLKKYLTDYPYDF